LTREKKKSHIKSWSDEKLIEVLRGHENGEYELGDDDIGILMDELRSRGIEIPREKLNRKKHTTQEPSGATPVADSKGSGAVLDDDDDQVPIGYIKLYPETPQRNEFYRKRYDNARRAWRQTNIIQKGEKWFIVAKGEAEFGYDVHLYETSDGTVHGTCTCADFTQRGVRRNFPCKHIFMVLVHQGITKKWDES